MIRLLVRLTLALTVILSVGMLAARAIGGTRPNPVAAWRTNPDGSSCGESCLFGIVPGVTSRDEAVRLINAHSLTHNLTGVYGGTNTAITVLRDSDTYFGIVVDPGQVVNALYLRWSNDKLYFLNGSHASLADIILVFGTPAYVGLRPLYSPADIYLLGNNYQITVESYCKDIIIGGTRLSYIFGLPLASQPSDIQQVSWRGFATHARYWQIALAQHPENNTNDPFQCTA